MKSLKEKIEVMQHFLNGGEVEAINEHFDYWYDEKKPNWDWNLHDYRIKEYQYPIYFKHKLGEYIVRFDSLKKGEVVVTDNKIYKKGDIANDWLPHTDSDWKQVEKPKDKIVIEKWLCRDIINNEYFEYSSSRIDIALNNFAFSTEKIKLLDTYEVEV